MTLLPRKAPCAPDFLEMKQVHFFQLGVGSFIMPFASFLLNETFCSEAGQKLLHENKLQAGVFFADSLS